MSASGTEQPVTRQWLRLLAELDASPFTFVAPGVLMFAASVLEGLSVALLVPTLEGVLTQDFSRVARLPVVEAALRGPLRGLAGSDRGVALLLVGAIAAVILLKVTVFFRARVLFAVRASRLADTLRRRLFGRYLSFGKRFFDDNNAGQLQAILLTHTGTLAQGAGTFGLALNHACTIVVFGGVMLWLSWQLTFVVAALFPLLFFSLGRVVRAMRAQSDSAFMVHRNLQELVFNLLACMPLLKAYQQQARELGRFGALSGELAEVELDQQRRVFWIGPVHELLLLSFVAALVLFVTRFEVAAPASVLVFFYALKRTSTYVNDLNHLRAELARISRPLAVVLDALTDPNKPAVPEGAREFQGLHDRIDVHRLTFSFSPDGPRVLSDVSFSVRRGKTTAIVGRTGSGKSTLISLLLRFYDVGPGMILLDGVDIREFTHGSLRRHLALVPQDCQLFNGTMRDNVLYGLEREVSPEELAEATRAARLQELIERLPAGLDTEIGDRGVKLSGGEKQRLAIARALLKRAEILILDEATSSLDSRTERLVQEAIDECLVDRTAIVVAHRLATIQHADEIVLIEDGLVIERGTLDELLAADGAFRTYWEAQRFTSGAGDRPLVLPAPER